MDHIAPQSSNSTAESQGWTGFILLGLSAVLAGLYWFIVYMPQQFGKPLLPQAMQINMLPELFRDCELQRSIKLLTRVYRRPEFLISVKESTRIAPSACESGDPNVYVFKSHLAVAARSGWGKNNNCRVTEVDPEHLDFSKRTMPHEFGHHRFGDVGLPEWVLLFGLTNALYDCRNDFIIWLHT